MKKAITFTLALLLLVVTMRVANADRYFVRSFKQSSLQMLNRPSTDVESEFTKDITILEWAELYTKVGKPGFQAIKTDKGTMLYFYVNLKEGLYGRVSWLKEDKENE